MTLVNRVSVFFVAALAVCVCGYSFLLYGAIRRHLFAQFDQQLNGAMRVLAAALEVEPDGVKWQPSDHAVSLGDEEADEVRWMLVDEAGAAIDQSLNLNYSASEGAALLDWSRSADGTTTDYSSRGDFRVLVRTLRAALPKPQEEFEIDEFAQITVVVAMSAKELESELNYLAVLMTGAPLLLCVFAAVTGRSYCRNALRPVGAMAERARAMEGAVDFSARLPMPPHQDELASLANAFNSLLAKLQSAYLHQQRFTGDAAHQLRTPLTVLRGEIDVALRRPRSTEEYRRVLSALSGLTSEFELMVESLLLLARSEGAAPTPGVCSLNVEEWLHGIKSHWIRHPRYNDLSLEAATDLEVSTSKPLASQAVQNLIGNALKYSPAGSEVEITAESRKGCVAISVRDYGTGIAADEIDTVFEPFYRSATARESGAIGTGLGLAVALRIATALGGRLRCESRVGLGSCFTLELPR